MTAKEKAEELINKYGNIEIYIPQEPTDIYGTIGNIANDCVKTSALICVDEIINLGFDNRLYLGSNDLNFWKEVKQEIINCK